MIWAYVVIVIMIMLSAYFSASEIAFNASNKLRLRRAAEGGSKTAALAYRISENFTTSLSAILAGNNLANIAVSTCTTLIVMDLFPGNDGLASTLATIIVTVVILIFGEIVPKILSKQHADTVVRLVAYPTRVLTILLFPVVGIIMLLVRGLRFIWGKDRGEEEPTVTEEELSTIIDTVEEEGVIDEDQGELLQSALEFHDITVEKIMTPRIDVTAIDIDDDEEEIHALVSDPTQFSRIPVYEGSIDNIIGILSLNRYYKAAIDQPHPDIRALLLPPCKIHKTMKLPAALARMRETKMHLAVVIDEYGGVLGVVTMEDILEELVGDIWDDTDVIKTECRATGENTFEVSGDMNIEDCFEEIGFEAPEDFSCEYSTMGGWAVEMLEANPHVGDNFNYQNLFVVVSEMEEERVTKLTVLVNPLPEEEEEE
ncbi:MAG: hemolysin family protein [Clostridia bacterium]|nr:hemolysin family protein [Clostridia bacterium]MDD7701235.1 hemolysin family protein [Eubacteriales bacterium]MDY2826726.1 hemolysin family protein [Eubacteriales bacterium]